jgi:hypothetical protein
VSKSGSASLITEGVLVSYITHISASIDKFISEIDRDFVVLRRYWLEGEEENIPLFEGVW